MSNQEKETPRIKRLLKEGKLAYINKATLPSEFTASAQGDQSTIPSEVSHSESKVTTSSPNMQEEGAKFSLREINDRFNEELATLTEENKDKVNLSLGMPSDILLAAGVVNKPMKLYSAKLWAKSQKHGYKVSDLRDLPKNVAAPIAIFKGSTDGSHAVLTEIKVGENNVLATLSVGKGGEDIDFNIISSVYGKQGNNVVKWIDDGKLEYVDKEKALNYLHHSAPIAEALSNPRLISTTKVIQNFENPKIEPRYSLRDAETEKIFAAAKEKFGTTYDMREAGYILPDGSMLDFSGRHQVRGGDTSFLNGDRTVDHREIADIAYDFDENETGVETDMGDFLDRGAIRIDYNAGAINLNVAPTKAQKDRLKRLIERNEGYVYIDFGKGWDTEHYAEYEAARASRVLGDIDRYFDEGIKPAGNVRFSIQDVEAQRFNRKVEFIKGIVRDFNIPNPLFIAETMEEFVQMVKEYDGDVDEFTPETYGYYCSSDDIILLNGGVLITSGDAHRSTMHEYAHSITKKYLGERLAEVTVSILETEIDKARKEMLPEAYNEYSYPEIIDEFTSLLLEDLTIAETRAIFEGEMAIDTFVEKLKKDINAIEKISNKDVLYAVIPLVVENLKIQTEQYGKDREHTIVIPRVDSRRNPTFSKTSHLSGDKKSRSIEAEYGVYETGRGGEGTQEEVNSRYALLSAPITEEEQIRIYLRQKHLKNKEDIRKKYRAYRSAALKDMRSMPRIPLYAKKTSDLFKLLVLNTVPHRADYLTRSRARAEC